MSGVFQHRNHSINLGSLARLGIPLELEFIVKQNGCCQVKHTTSSRSMQTFYPKYKEPGFHFTFFSPTPWTSKQVSRNFSFQYEDSTNLKWKCNKKQMLLCRNPLSRNALIPGLRFTLNIKTFFSGKVYHGNVTKIPENLSWTIFKIQLPFFFFF